VWWLLYVLPYGCVVFTILNALLECGGYHMYRLMDVWCLLYLKPYQSVVVIICTALWMSGFYYI